MSAIVIETRAIKIRRKTGGNFLKGRGSLFRKRRSTGNAFWTFNCARCGSRNTKCERKAKELDRRDDGTPKAALFVCHCGQSNQVAAPFDERRIQVAG